jgi:hypothetical protein
MLTKSQNATPRSEGEALTTLRYTATLPSLPYLSNYGWTSLATSVCQMSRPYHSCAEYCER